MGKVAEAISRGPISDERIERCSDLPLSIPRRWRPADVDRIVGAIWDYQDARRAAFKYECDFDRAEADLRASFVAWLRANRNG